MKDTVAVIKAADLLGVNQGTIRKWIISGKCKFGDAVQMEKDYSYIIPKERFETYISGRDMNIDMELITELSENVKYLIKLLTQKEKINPNQNPL